jgi:hypothetical protein
MFPQIIKIRVSWHQHLRKNSQTKNTMSENPLFIIVLNSPIFPPLTSRQHTQRGQSGETCRKAEVSPNGIPLHKATQYPWLK